jgi:hypothetical protein
MLVSRLWHGEAEAQLYSNVEFNSSHKHYRALVPALTARKHLLRRVAWIPNEGCETVDLKILDILLDYRPDNPTDLAFLVSHNNTTTTTTHMTATASLSPALSEYTLGPNRPALTHFSFYGDGEIGICLNSVVYSLTTLTVLDLCFPFIGVNISYIVDMDKTLTALPCLKVLSVDGDGWMYTYAQAAETPEDRNEATGPELQHCLESFKFSAHVLCCEGSAPFAFFRRLGNLRRIDIGSEYSFYMNTTSYRPWAFGRALRQYCPKLESIVTDTEVRLWLFDLPILSADRIAHITAPVADTFPFNIESDMSHSTIYGIASEYEDRLRQLLQEQEVEELLEGKAAVPFFPQLKTLVIAENILSAQDLISLGVQAPFLTHFEIRCQPARDGNFWDIYERDASAATKTAIHSSIPSIDAMIENQRLRKRRSFTSSDLVLLLQLCSSLRYFSLAGYCIYFDDLVDALATVATGTPVIQPWACEKTLETLNITIKIPVENPEQHSLIWKHLGRCWRLRSLKFSQECCLVPSFTYGIAGLLEGGMGETLKEIRRLPEWREVKDPREMVLWFGRSCPRLMVLGIEHTGYVMDAKRRGTTFKVLDDEDAKQCSIHRVFVEPN